MSEPIPLLIKGKEYRMGNLPEKDNKLSLSSPLGVRFLYGGTLLQAEAMDRQDAMEKD